MRWWWWWRRRRQGGGKLGATVLPGKAVSVDAVLGMVAERAVIRRTEVPSLQEVG